MSPTPKCTTKAKKPLIYKNFRLSFNDKKKTAGRYDCINLLFLIWRRKRDSILAAARSRSRENNTQLFSNALAPLRYPCLLGKRFSRRNTLADFRRKYRTLTELKRGWKPGKILPASVTLSKVALCASLPQAKARGAICASVLASELADTPSLDYNRGWKPSKIKGFQPFHFPKTPKLQAT